MQHADLLDIRTFSTRAEMGQAAGAHAARAIAAAIAARGAARVILASAPSQDETLGTLIAAPGIDWGRVTIFHMDEYLGLPAGHPQTFRAYQQAKVLSRITPAAFHG